MLLLTQDKRIVNLDCMAIIDTASLQVFARQDCCDGSENVYVMPDK